MSFGVSCSSELKQCFFFPTKKKISGVGRHSQFVTLPRCKVSSVTKRSYVFKQRCFVRYFISDVWNTISLWPSALSNANLLFAAISIFEISRDLISATIPWNAQKWSKPSRIGRRPRKQGERSGFEQKDLFEKSATVSHISYPYVEGPTLRPLSIWGAEWGQRRVLLLWET